jgi:acetyl-CoA carboxylase biotin carboxyl carrier protein
MDLSKFKDLKDLKSLLDLMGAYDLNELELEDEGRKIRLRKLEPRPAREVIGYAAPPVVEGAGASEARAAAMSEAKAPPESVHEVTSPLVGTFYRSPSPEAEAFVREGDRVEPDAMLCIIEAMKVMNEIRAGVAGVVKEILVKNADAVEFGQPLFRIDTG